MTIIALAIGQPDLTIFSVVEGYLSSARQINQAASKKCLTTAYIYYNLIENEFQL